MSLISIRPEAGGHAAIDNLTGTNELVPAKAGKRIIVLSYQFVTNPGGDVSLQDDAGTPKKLTGAMPAAAGVPVVANFNPYGHGTTGVNQALDLVSTVAVDGHLTYVYID